MCELSQSQKAALVLKKSEISPETSGVESQGAGFQCRHVVRPLRRPRVWGSKIRFGVSCGQSGGDVVLMGESAEDLPPVDPVLGKVDRFGWAGVCLSRGELAEGAVRPGRV